MGISGSWVAVGSTPVLLCSPTREANDTTTWIEIYNSGPQSVYLGGSNVTSTSGRVVVSTGSWSTPLAYGDAIYACTASSTATLQVLLNRS